MRLGDDIVVAGEDEDLFIGQPLGREFAQPLHPGELVGVFLRIDQDCRSAGRGSRRAATRLPGSENTASMKARLLVQRIAGQAAVTSSGLVLERIATPLKPFWPCVST
jgi:hypothetical protein